MASLACIILFTGLCFCGDELGKLIWPFLVWSNAKGAQFDGFLEPFGDECVRRNVGAQFRMNLCESKAVAFVEARIHLELLGSHGNYANPFQGMGCRSNVDSESRELITVTP